MLSRLDLPQPQGLRARAQRLLGFAGAFRRAALVGLTLEHLRLVHDVADEVLGITLPMSKTNQVGETEQKAFCYADNPAYCPLKAYKVWWSPFSAVIPPVFMVPVIYRLL